METAASNSKLPANSQEDPKAIPNQPESENPSTLLANEPTEEQLLRHLPKRGNPPIIILKLDDLSQKEGTILPGFLKMAALLEARKIKGSFGLICAVGWPGAQSLEQSGPEYIEWVKKLHHAGLIEIWFHGWDHAGHTENGEVHCEFHNRTYEEQKARFDNAQDIAKEKLGFHFQTFGPGGTMSKYPSIDENTLRVLAEEPYIQTYFAPTPAAYEEAKFLESEGKVVLRRIPDVNLEKSVGQTDFKWFLTGYARHPDIDYFPLQGHPNTWDDAKFSEVFKIIDFLIQQKAVFMTPSEFAATRKN